MDRKRSVLVSPGVFAFQIGLCADVAHVDRVPLLDQRAHADGHNAHGGDERSKEDEGDFDNGHFFFLWLSLGYGRSQHRLSEGVFVEHLVAARLLKVPLAFIL